MAFPERRKNHKEDQEEMTDVCVFVLDEPDFILVVLKDKERGTLSKGACGRGRS